MRSRRSALLIFPVLFAVASSSARGQSLFGGADGVQGMTPEAYYALLDEARRLMNATDATSLAAAASKLDQLTTAYAHDGETWARLARARFALGEWRPALEAGKRAYALGAGYQSGLYKGFTQHAAMQIAAAHARLGDGDSAMRWVERAFDVDRLEAVDRLKDVAFDGVRDAPRTRRLLGLDAVAPDSRHARWRADISFLRGEIRRLNPAFRDAPLPAAAQAWLAIVERDAATMTDAAIVVTIQRALAALGQSHNLVLALFEAAPSPTAFTALPVSFHAFPEGLFVVNADSTHQRLIGRRVTRVGRTGIDSAFRVLRPLVPNDHPANESYVLRTIPRFLAVPQLLHAAGLSDSRDTIALELTDAAGARETVRLVGTSRRLSSRLAPPPGFGASAAPLWLRNPSESVWHAPLPLAGAYYLAFNQVANTRGASLQQFGARFRETLDSAAVRALVVDLRHNSGGNSYLYTSLLRTLVWFGAKPGTRLFVLTSRNTYSAAQNFLNDLDRLTDAVVVGEPSGGTPIMRGGDAGTITLPHSQLAVNLTSAVWQLTSPRDARPYVAPAMPVALSAAAYFAGQDPVLDAVLALLR